MKKNWIECYVDQMALIVALSGEARFSKLRELKEQIGTLTHQRQMEVKDAIRLRFTPSNGEDGCQSATESVKSIL